MAPKELGTTELKRTIEYSTSHFPTVELLGIAISTGSEQLVLLEYRHMEICEAGMQSD